MDQVSSTHFVVLLVEGMQGELSACSGSPPQCSTFSSSSNFIVGRKHFVA